jgi:hypothetical protein
MEEEQQLISFQRVSVGKPEQLTMWNALSVKLL